MARALHRAKAILEMLEDREGLTVLKATFSKSVKTGNMPFLRQDGIKHNLFDYDVVIDIIKKNGLYGYDPKVHKPPSKKDTTPEEPKEEDVSVEELWERLETNPTLVDANTLKTIIALKRDQLKLDMDEGQVISRDKVENRAFIVTRTIRDKILSQPERLANELASMSNPHEIKELLYKEALTLLDGFSKESFLD